MAKLEKGRKNFRIDRRFRKIGEIKKSAGTNDKATFKKMLVMLDELYTMPRWDILRDIRDGISSPLQVYDSYKVQKLDGLSSAATIKKLNPTLFDFAASHDVAPSTRIGYKGVFQGFLREAPLDATVEDIPTLLSRYKKVCAQRGTFRVFNLCRSALQAFLRATVRPSHRLWIAVSEIEPFETKARKRKGNPQTVKQVLALMEHLTPKYRQVVWSLFISGMGPKEYLGPWEVKDGALHIHGTKRLTRDRVIPLVQHPIRHHIHGRSFAQVLSKASGATVQPYDLRRSFAKLMEDAGITRTRRRIYMGHSVGDMTEGYERHEVEEYLAGDAERLQKYIEREKAAYSKQTAVEGTAASLPEPDDAVLQGA